MSNRIKGPFQLQPCARNCPECKKVLFTTRGLDWNILRGAYHEMGIMCHCTECHNRFRATGTLTFQGIFFTAMGVVLLAIGFLMFFIFFYVNFYTLRIVFISGLFCSLIFLPRFLFFVSEKVWWKNARLANIFSYEGGEL